MRNNMLSSLAGEGNKDNGERPGDLDGNAPNYLLVDSINFTEDSATIDDKKPFNRLRTELIQHVKQRYPTIIFKSGWSDRGEKEEVKRYASSLANAIDANKDGAHLVMLDVRQRPIIKAMDRSSLIEKAQRAYELFCKDLTGCPRKVCEPFDSCAIGYWKHILFEDGYPRLTDTSKLKPPSITQIADVSKWLAWRFCEDFWEVLTKETKEDTEQVEAGTTCNEHFKIIGDCLEEHMNVLLSSDSCHGVNVMDLQGASRLLDALAVKKIES